MSFDRIIRLNEDVAGRGWLIDVTPWEYSAFTTPGDQGEPYHIDLLSAVMHERGHVNGRGRVLGPPRPRPLR